MTIKLWDEIVAFHSDVSLNIIIINSTVTYFKRGFLIVPTVFESNAVEAHAHIRCNLLFKAYALVNNLVYKNSHYVR